MYPGVHGKTVPDKPAVVMATSGEVVTYRQLDERSSQGAHLLRSLGLRRGDHMAICMENNAHYHAIAWAAQRAGIYYTAISSRLTAPEVEYILDDCDARVLITSREKGELAGELLGKCPKLIARFAVNGDVPGHERWETAAGQQPTTPIADESEGAPMLYSSGTTGRPKGVKHPLMDAPIGTPNPLVMLIMGLYQGSADAIYLSPAPLYHSAPLGYTMSFLRLGATVIVMEHFDAEQALALIEKHRVTHSQWVPTMFVRMLKLPEAVRAKYDVSSLRVAVHAAAPCPVEVKEKMIAWWGPVLYEYYAGTEGQGFVAIDSQEWLQHKGSVGRALNAKLHILDDEFNELPAGEVGTIYFESAAKYSYHKDEAKTASARSPQGWTTLGDVGYVDAEGWLYLTDRKAFMIISGGVNIYPQETENCLIGHPKVTDVAVVGIPNEDFGEEVKAVVQPVSMALAGPELERELIEWCKERISHVKCPRSVDFMEELPRHPTGKLYKRLIKDRYWGNKTSRIV
jgi:acyl-CoA synthetase (AMP-forming)/AMP-acid ligase II